MNRASSKAGKVYLVGAGPGDPKLITLRGMELLQDADVIIYDALASKNLLKDTRDKAELIYVGKQAGKHSLPQDQINHLMIDKARQYTCVVRLKGGDPFVFGRGGEEVQELIKAGIDFEIVPGITAGIAAPAYAGIPITHRELASDVAFITGHEADREGESQVDWPSLGRWKGTLVFYMGVKNLAAICRNLIDHGMAGDTPAALIEWGTTARQRTLTATVSTLAEQAEREAFSPPAVAVIGKVVQLRRSLKWFENKPLFGKRIVVTRPGSQSQSMADRLSCLGAEVIEFPVIRIVPSEDRGPLQQAVAEIDRYDWVIFTSVNGVSAFFDELHQAGKDSRALGAVRICVIGPATAEMIRTHGIEPDVIPPDYVSEAIVSSLLKSTDIKDKRFLLPRADIARKDLIRQLKEAGAMVDDIIAYRTVAEDIAADDLIDALEHNSIDWITFTSSSTVRYFLEKVKPELVMKSNAKCASIGPVTSAALLQNGLDVAFEAEQYTSDGLVEAICRAEANKQKNV